jgi:hypothetical protein
VGAEDRRPAQATGIRAHREHLQQPPSRIHLRHHPAHRLLRRPGGIGVALSVERVRAADAARGRMCAAGRRRTQQPGDRRPDGPLPAAGREPGRCTLWQVPHSGRSPQPGPPGAPGRGDPHAVRAPPPRAQVDRAVGRRQPGRPAPPTGAAEPRLALRGSRRGYEWWAGHRTGPEQAAGPGARGRAHGRDGRLRDHGVHRTYG